MHRQRLLNFKLLQGINKTCVMVKPGDGSNDINNTDKINDFNLSKFKLIIK